jgi:hypothetical protein
VDSTAQDYPIHIDGRILDGLSVTFAESLCELAGNPWHGMREHSGPRFLTRDAARRSLPARKISGWCRSKPWQADARLRSAEAARRKPLQKGVSGLLSAISRSRQSRRRSKIWRISKIEPEKIAAQTSSVATSSFRRCAPTLIASSMKKIARIDCGIDRNDFEPVFSSSVQRVSITDNDEPSITRHVRRPVAKAPVSMLIRFGPTCISRVGVCP